MIDRNLILKNEKVLLSPMTRQDLSLLQPLAADPSLWIYFTHDLSNPEGLEDWAAPHFSNERLQFIVRDINTQEVMGSTAFGNFSSRDGRVEIGWTWLGKKFQGTGVNKWMKQVMLDYCFFQLKLKRVEFKTDVLNLPARKALKNLGATEEGILRSHTQMTHGRRRDTIYYSILEGEWPR